MEKKVEHGGHLRSARPIPSVHLLECPKCQESLSQADVEFFQCCPFCGHRFELDSDLEDFILEPVVKNWIRQQDLLPNGKFR